MTQWGLDNLFNPGKRHMDDEKRRLQSTREEIGDNSGGRRIDLEGGRVSISVPGGPPISVPADDSEPTDDAGVLDAAIEAEDLPAVALASDAEIEPDVVHESVAEPVVAEHAEPTTEPAVEPAPEPVAEVAPEPVAEVVPEPVAELVPEPVVEPAAQPAPRRRAVSASAWSRQG